MARASNVLTPRLALAQLVLALACLLPLGCATTWLEGFDHDQSMHCRIDNPDRDNLWDTSDTNGNGVIDEGEHAGVVFDLNSSERSTSIISIASAIDFDDLHTFFLYHQLNIIPYTETYGMQLSQSNRFSVATNNLEPPEQPSYVDVSYGARYLRLRESRSVQTIGGILGNSLQNTTFDNELIGPQLAIGWGTQQFGWDIQLGTTLMLGYDVAKGSQSLSIGQDIVPGRLNRPAFAESIVFTQGQNSQEFSSIAEIRAEAAYEISRAVALRLGYTALYISHSQQIDNMQTWQLPNLGITTDASTQDTWLSGLHASVEWRR